MTRVLFICGKARKRSPTAADLVAGWTGFETDFAGLSRDADEQLSSEQLAWAELVVVMERRHKSILSRRFGHALHGVRVACADVPDRFEYMAPDLVQLLTGRLRPILLR